MIDEILKVVNCKLQLLRLPLAEHIPGNAADAVDGYLQFGKEVREIELKKNLTAANLPRLLPQLTRRQCILATTYITSAMMEMLLNNEIEYADLAGNMNLRPGGNCILVQNCGKPACHEKSVYRGRSWSVAGLKVLFLLLTEPEALQWNMREIGRLSGVGLGTVKYVLEDLRERNELVTVNGIRRWTNRDELMMRWSREYTEKLFPKIPHRRFTGSWNDFDCPYPVVWSGETAAELLHLMQSGRLCIYQCGNVNEMILRGRWLPDENGNIELREAFWPEARALNGMAPPLLIYADLLAENDGRCLEAARLVYERFLKET